MFLSHRPSRATLLTILLPTLALAEPTGDGVTAGAGSANDAPAVAVKKLTVAPGLQVDLWAAEPMIENVVAFSFDEWGRAFVAETGRRRTSVPDIRGNMSWIVPDLALRTVEERIALLKKTLAPELALKPTKLHADINGDGQFDWRDWEVESERVQLVEDRDGDGKADHASVFATGFNTLATGVGAGVLARNGEVWFACSPDLWRLRESSGGQPATRESLLTGFGVHVAYGGHDTHGVKMGPDGRIYWTVADCGAHVTTREGKLIDTPNTGSVFRANPDGTGMELVASGLRNPQSLAWNDVGDLFTGDNNADGGDKARWEHIVDGGDYGWRMGWQFLPKLGAWNSEKMWELNIDRTALALLPPVGHIGHGPAGIAYYPGTGLPEKYRDHFFYADFPGGVRDFALVPRGASYTVANPADVLQDNKPAQMTGKLLWGLDPSDVQFSTDGGAYVLDWTNGWEKSGKGRIFRVHDAAVDKSEAVLETKKLLGEGMTHRVESELGKLLGHVDQRVRLAAQFELVSRGDPIPLARATLNTNSRLMRLHGIWGVAQLARTQPGAARSLMPMFADSDAEVRAQWARFVGDARVAGETDLLIRMLGDAEPRVRFFAAMALGKVGGADAVPALFTMLRDNADEDAFLRHAGLMGLLGCGDVPALTAAARDSSDAVRTAVLLALRRLRNPEIAAFLTDANPQLVLEAARAIHDDSIEAAMPRLAALEADNSKLPEPIALRVIDANFRLGTPESAARLAHLGAAVGQEKNPALAIAALRALADWNSDTGIDRITGLARPLAADRVAAPVPDFGTVWDATVDKNTPPPLSNANLSLLFALMCAPQEARVAALGVVEKLKLSAFENAALSLASGHDGVGGATRAAALRALAALNSAGLADAVRAALESTDKTLLAEARKLSAKLSPKEAAKALAPVLESGSVAEQQGALATLGALPGTDVDALLTRWLDRVASGNAPTAIQLDILMAAGLRGDAGVKGKLAAIEAARKNTDPLSRWRECLEGGDAKAGREIFAEKAEVACLRCHKVRGEGGDVGPDLAGIATRHDRAYILTSIVAPNAVIATGFENALITLKDGNMLAGLVAGDGTETLTITPLGGGPKTTVKASDVARRDKVPSAMPDGLGDLLGKRDLRNVVEYLAGLK